MVYFSRSILDSFVGSFFIDFGNVMLNEAFSVSLLLNLKNIEISQTVAP